jgi:hypothetical protein
MESEAVIVCDLLSQAAPVRLIGSAHGAARNIL